MTHRITRWAAALALAPLAACASNTPPTPPAPPPPPPLASSDASFVNAIAQANLAEIAEAQLALQQSPNTRIKTFAQQMITDHTKLNDQLAPIASAHGVTLPTTPDASQQQQLQSLQALHGWRFDHAYIADQIQDHQAALRLAQSEAQDGTAPELKQYAEAGVPIIQGHLEAAEALRHKAAHGHRHTHRYHSAS